MNIDNKLYVKIYHLLYTEGGNMDIWGIRKNVIL